MSERVVIVGGGAGGSSCATRLRRLREDVEIVVLEKGQHPSFASCGLPYYVGGVIEERDDLFITTPRRFRDRFNIDVRTENSCLGVDTGGRTVRVKSTDGGEEREYDLSYDKLVLSPGARPLFFSIPGLSLERTFVLRDIPDTDRMRKFIDETKPARATVIGGGFIGLEVAENLVRKGIKVTIVELAEQVMAPLDPEMASFIHEHLTEKGVDLVLGESVNSCWESTGRPERCALMLRLKSGKELDSDMVVMAAGIRPDTSFLDGSGIDRAENGAILVNENMRTSDENVYALGDSAITKHSITDSPMLVPLAWPANRQGRMIAENLAGRKSAHDGYYATAIAKIFDLTAGSTGASQKMLDRHNAGNPKSRIEYFVSYTHHFHHASYYPGARFLSTKLIIEKKTGKILGAQMVGEKGVDKRLDVIVTAMYGGLTVEELGDLELAYAPPYSSARDPINQAGYAAWNILSGEMPVIHFHELDSFASREGTAVIDVRSSSEFSGGAHPRAVNIPIDSIRKNPGKVPRDKEIVVICGTGYRSYNAQRFLMNSGWAKVYNLSGGWKTYLAGKAIRKQ